MNNRTRYSSRLINRKVKGTLIFLYGGLLALLSCFSSCQKDSTLASGDEDKITLNVNLGSSGGEVATRGVSEDLADGSYFYRVTLLIVDSSNKLVATEDWNNIISSLPTEVSTTITGLNPSTTYRMIAVANYSAYDTWEGLPNFPTIANLTVGTDISATLTALNNYTLPATGDDNVVAKNPQPLSLVQEFTTPASGSMDVEGELLRTYARLCVEIANRSESQVLTVNSLKFGSETSKFGYNSTPLMMVGDDAIPAANGNLVETSTDAITPFSAPLQVPTLNDASGNSRVAFDGYLYECKNTDGFEYSLSLSYPIETTTTKVVYKKETRGTTSPSSGLYMIGYGNNNYYLTANGTTGLTGTQVAKNVTELDATQYAQVIWEVYYTGRDYYIKSVMNNRYIALSTSGVSLNSTESPLNLSNGKLYVGSRTLYYLNASNASISSNRSSGTTLTFYPITEDRQEISSGSTTTKDIVVPLETIVDGVSSPAYIIRRNDFINVLVTVSYNENSGTIEFQVKDWNTGGGNVEFN